MRKIPFPKMLLFTACILVPAALASAQETKTGEPQADVHQPPPNEQPDVRGNMLRQLGLTREQFQQIRRIQVERGPMMKEAQLRFREANRALDAAIYADEVNEAVVQARLKDIQIAQAEVQRLRYMNELAVRRILTPEQLVHFRELRERFERARQNLEDARPFRNMRQMERQVLPNDQRTMPPQTGSVKQDQTKPDQ